MNRPRKKTLAVALLALATVGFALPQSAEAGRYRRVVRRSYVAPAVVVASPRVYRRAYVAAPVVYTSPGYYRRGVAVGYGGVSVVAPGVSVSVGF